MLERHIFPKKTKEYGSSYVWKRFSPRRNASTPARSIIRSRLPGIKGDARDLRNAPKKEDV